MLVLNKYIYNLIYYKKKKFIEINNGLVMFQIGQKKIEVYALDTVYVFIVSIFIESLGLLN